MKYRNFLPYQLNTQKPENYNNWFFCH